MSENFRASWRDDVTPTFLRPEDSFRDLPGVYSGVQARLRMYSLLSLADSDGNIGNKWPVSSHIPQSAFVRHIEGRLTLDKRTLMWTHVI
jgi:hypothetical protein